MLLDTLSTQQNVLNGLICGFYMKCSFLMLYIVSFLNDFYFKYLLLLRQHEIEMLDVCVTFLTLILGHRVDFFKYDALDLYLGHHDDRHQCVFFRLQVRCGRLIAHWFFAHSACRAWRFYSFLLLLGIKSQTTCLSHVIGNFLDSCIKIIESIQGLVQIFTLCQSNSTSDVG